MPTNHFNVSAAVDELLIERARHNDRKYDVFHPSEWDGCHRKIAYSFYESQGVITIDKAALKFDPQLERIFDNGHFMHARWGRYLEELGILRGKWMCKNWMAHTEKGVEQGDIRYVPRIFGQDNTTGVPKPDRCECGSDRFEYVELGFHDEMVTNWGGHLDAIVDIPGSPEGTPPIIVDFKTMNPFQFGTLDSPLPKHKTQMQIYLYLSKLQMGKFIYEDKGNQKVKEFNVYRDDDYIAVKVEEAKFLRKCVTGRNKKGQRALPDRAYMSAGHKECMKCKYRGHCWR
jgi:hypothetical protein